MIIYTLYYSGCFFAVHFLVLFSCYSRFKCAFGYVNGKVKLFFSALCFCPFHAAPFFSFVVHYTLKTNWLKEPRNWLTNLLLQYIG